MAVTGKDRALVQRCLQHEPGAWREFVDRFLGLFYHVVHHTAHLRSVPLSAEDTEDVVAEILLQIVARDYQILRLFRGQSSLATYLTVIARRLCIHDLNRRAKGEEIQTKVEERPRPRLDQEEKARAATGADALDEVQKLLRGLPPGERQVVRLFYLEGKTYDEISKQLNLPVNTIGPILSRARARLRKASTNPSAPHDSQPRA
ncbi:MAG: sigma-70 family RNA polymerase sigma factor [Planctomycetes bacterium]|nr:sigma-70 family RNA polymerase sigma factor [Planctomycetota bacterium]